MEVAGHLHTQKGVKVTGRALGIADQVVYPAARHLQQVLGRMLGYR
jgi:hypothetical protein